MGKTRFPITARDVWAGLATSPFLGDIDRRDRDLGRLLGTIGGGLIVGAIGALASMILILVLYTLGVGRGGQGLDGVSDVALRLRDLSGPNLPLTMLELVIAAATNGVFAAAFVGVAALLAKHPFHHYLTAARSVRWRLLGTGLVLSLIVLAPVVAADRLFSSDSGTAPMFAVGPGVLARCAYAVGALLLIPAAAAEELIFRGWLTRQTAALTRRPAILIGFTALVFSTAHFDFSADGFLTRFLMGAGFAYMTLRLGGIEFPTAAHAANNILIVLFIQPLTLRSEPGAAALSAGSLLEDLAMVAGYVAITEAVVRIRPLRRWSGVKIEELSGSRRGALNPG